MKNETSKVKYWGIQLQNGGSGGRSPPEVGKFFENLKKFPLKNCILEKNFLQDVILRGACHFPVFPRSSRNGPRGTGIPRGGGSIPNKNRLKILFIYRFGAR